MRLRKAADRCEGETAQDRARSRGHQQKTKTRRADCENIAREDRHELSVRLGAKSNDAQYGKEC